MMASLIPDTAAFIIAGGQSSRMGTDKAFLRLGSITLIERAIDTLKGVCETVALVGDKQRLQNFGLVVEDRYPGQGPLAGIEAALQSDTSKTLNIVIAVDMPAVSAKLLKYILNIAWETGTVVTAPRCGGHIQPLCAVYRKEFGEVAERALHERRNKIEPLFSEVRTRVIEEDELKALGFSADIFDNVNTPEDWQRMQERFGVANR
ncbi:MAG TPA: molybdenum cofactor guanylyltransferase [Terriglobales bacterium]|nr:molybdenum cofactor guanylyltransferase [Terriglobales bacterium]